MRRLVGLVVLLVLMCLASLQPIGAQIRSTRTGDATGYSMLRLTPAERMNVLYGMLEATWYMVNAVLDARQRGIDPGDAVLAAGFLMFVEPKTTWYDFALDIWSDFPEKSATYQFFEQVIYQYGLFDKESLENALRMYRKR